MTPKRFVVFSIALLFVIACAAPVGWNSSPFSQETVFSDKTTPIFVTEVVNTPAPTITPSPTPIPDLSWADASNNLIANPADYEATIRNYYQESPSAFRGYATRYGSKEMSENILWNHTLEMWDQFQHTNYTFSYMGGGAGYINFVDDPTLYLLDSRDSLAWTRIVEGAIPWWWTLTADGKPSELEWSPNQLRMHDLMGGTFEENPSKGDFLQRVNDQYVGVIALKSPNDFGSEYCLFSGRSPYDRIGLVLVGDFAARNDWLPYTPVDTNDTHVNLGQRLYLDDKGKEWYWGADLPDHIFYKLFVNDIALFFLLPPENCDE